MIMIPRQMLAFEATSVDAASYVATTWMQGADTNQRFSVMDIQCIVGTTAVLSIVWSSGLLGTSPWATGQLEAGVALTANVLYNWSVVSKASAFFNFQTSATVTVKQLWVSDRKIW